MNPLHRTLHPRAGFRTRRAELLSGRSVRATDFRSRIGLGCGCAASCMRTIRRATSVRVPASGGSPRWAGRCRRARRQHGHAPWRADADRRLPHTPRLTPAGAWRADADDGGGASATAVGPAPASEPVSDPAPDRASGGRGRRAVHPPGRGCLAHGPVQITAPTTAPHHGHTRPVHWLCLIRPSGCGEPVPANSRQNSKYIPKLW
jgi:hypothetical protein